MGKNKSVGAGSGTASASAALVRTTATTTTKSAQTTSILRSAFAPSHFQLHLFASVIQSFDSQHLRLHDTNTGRLRSQHSTKSGSRITCLDWGFYGASQKKSIQSSSTSKRRRTNNDTGSVVVAYGTSSSEICMFSPTEGKIMATLVGGHEKGIRDFGFSPQNSSEAWSLGEDSNLVQWDLTANKPKRTFPLLDHATSLLALPSLNPPQILCASSAPSAIDLATSDDFRIHNFDSFKNPVRMIFRAPEEDGRTKFFLAADSDRYINLYDVERKQIVRTLITTSGIDKADISSSATSQRSLLAVINTDGVVELFVQPFQQAATVNGELSSKRKNLTRKSSAQIKLINTTSKKSTVPVFSVSVQGNDIVLATARGGVDIGFQKIPCLDEETGDLMFDGLREIPALISASSLQNANMNGVKDLGNLNMDESRTIVTTGGNTTEADAAIEISSSEESAEEDSDDEDMPDADVEGDADEDSEEAESDGEEEPVPENGNTDTAVVAAHDKNIVDIDEEEQEPSFGQLLAARHPDTIAISDSIDQDLATFSKSDTTNLALGSGISLGTVLTQALRTNDQSLLESCLHTTNEDIVRNTIQRLDSSLAATLLSKLAERLASRPGRTGSLLTWVRWTCIAHGSVIATRRDIANKIRTLYRVLGERSRTLDNLLLLKGKLDMLDAQLSYRQQLQAQRLSAGTRTDPNEPGMIVIEGEADQWSSDDEYDEAVGHTRAPKSKSKKKPLKSLSTADMSDVTSSEEDDEADKPMINGIKDHDSSSDDEEESDDEIDLSLHKNKNRIIDDEARESDQDESDLDQEEEDGSSSGSGSGSEDDEDEEDEEGDSEMDSFINDGSISEVEDPEGIDVDDDIDEDEDEDLPVKPKSKRTKFR